MAVVGKSEVGGLCPRVSLVSFVVVGCHDVGVLLLLLPDIDLIQHLRNPLSLVNQRKDALVQRVHLLFLKF
jgi:hypothetical protein